jgi:hypothetical protein
VARECGWCFQKPEQAAWGGLVQESYGV